MQDNSVAVNPFNLLMVNRGLREKTMVWWENQTDHALVTKVLRKACSHAEWHVGFALRNPKITENMVRDCINAYITPDGAQKMLSKKFPMAFVANTCLDRYNGKTNIEILITNGFTVHRVYGALSTTGVPFPVLHMLIDRHAKASTIELLLKQKHNPSYYVPMFFKSAIFFCESFKAPNDPNWVRTHELLEQYKRTPENPTDQIYPD